MNKVFIIVLAVLLNACVHHEKRYDSSGNEVRVLDCMHGYCERELSNVCGANGYRIFSDIVPTSPLGIKKPRRVITYRCGNE